MFDINKTILWQTTEFIFPAITLHWEAKDCLDTRMRELNPCLAQITKTKFGFVKFQIKQMANSGLFLTAKSLSQNLEKTSSTLVLFSIVSMTKEVEVV